MSSAYPYLKEELLIATFARLIGDAAHVAVGAASPMPAAACLLLREMNAALHIARPRVSLLHRRRANPFTEGSRELFDLAGQGRIDVFFLGGAQIDGQANINLVGTGEYPAVAARFPGSFGSAFMYFAARRTILFREEHSRRVLVPRVDFISAPGASPAGVWRAGGPQALLTGKALFVWHKDRARFTLASVHPGYTAEDIRADTGFDYDMPGSGPGAAGAVPTTPEPDAESLAILRGPVAREIAADYPDFARRVWRIERAA